MIPVVQLVMSLRYALGDMQGLNVSDYELIEPINQAASTIYGTLSQRFVHAVIKKAILDVDDTKMVGLPPDYVRVHQVVSDDFGVLVPTSMNPPAPGTYRILGEIFYANKGTYTFEYYYIPARVNTLSDRLDAPESMRTFIEQMSLAIFKKEMDKVAVIMQQCENVLAGREISHFENTTPSQVLGGRV